MNNPNMQVCQCPCHYMPHEGNNCQCPCHFIPHEHRPPQNSNQVWQGPRAQEAAGRSSVYVPPQHSPGVPIGAQRTMPVSYGNMAGNALVGVSAVVGLVVLGFGALLLLPLLFGGNK